MTTTQDPTQGFMEAANRLPRIFSLTEETVELLALLEEQGDESELVARLEEVEALLAQKFDRAAWTVRDLERLAAARRDEADNLRETAKRLEAVADRVRKLMLDHMKATGKDKVVTPRYTISVHKNPWHVDVLEERMVPARFKELVTTVHIDKRAILQAVTKDGEVVDGVSVSRGERLSIS